MERKERLDLLRKVLAGDDISAMIISSSDPHFGEYIPEHYKTLQWLSGFTGEAATLVVTQNEAALWVDSRFFIQAAAQLEGSGIELMKLKMEGTPSVTDWLKSHLEEGDIVAMDEDLVSYAEYMEMSDSLAPLSPALIEDPFDKIWKDRPALEFNPVRFVDESVSGESVSSKHRRLVEKLRGPVPFVYIVTALDEVAWLCNIRGADIEYNPLPLSYAVVTEECVTLFLRQEMLGHEAMSALLREGVILKDYEDFGRFLKNLPKTCVRIFSSGKITAKYFFASMDNIHQRAPFNPYMPDPVPGGTLAMMKAVKNKVELEGFRKAFAEDAKAMAKVIEWVKANVDKGITEHDVAMKLIECRSECPDYIGESFPAIVAFGANAAQPHYMPSEDGGAVIRPEGFLLIDTGGQYTYGTTDTTRTIPLGPLTQRQKDDYTAVLKGMIDLSMAVFRKGMRGCLLDILARGPVMKAGRMYLHGTSHGIGHNLCVHEGPQSIRMEENKVALTEGMVLSNEPAAYIEGGYGIRHENVITVVSCTEEGYGDFYRFETLTVLPIDLSPVNMDMLDSEERSWIEDFNARCIQ
ncbi:MAG TPA: M24 family metallopeptidase [Candidatus Coprenecus stercoravium]|uniref:M24 family metallopeptidase n=1 Tax=Candidatus Coprenecus stercoravium TaxID=2840735 RepID=A0A9D2KA27_9BACT|nr:M24 family metallopeptidase [Candidatus Coprenecus stercoravium]